MMDSDSKLHTVVPPQYRGVVDCDSFPSRFDLTLPPLKAAIKFFSGLKMVSGDVVPCFDLVLADGYATDTSLKDYSLKSLWNAQERIFCTQLLVAFGLVNVGGDIVIKCFYHPPINVLKWLVPVAAFFEAVTLWKPPSSSPANYERYLILHGRRPIHSPPSNDFFYPSNKLNDLGPIKRGDFFVTHGNLHYCEGAGKSYSCFSKARLESAYYVDCLANMVSPSWSLLRVYLFLCETFPESCEALDHYLKIESIYIRKTRNALLQTLQREVYFSFPKVYLKPKPGVSDLEKKIRSQNAKRSKAYEKLANSHMTMMGKPRKYGKFVAVPYNYLYCLEGVPEKDRSFPKYSNDPALSPSLDLPSVEEEEGYYSSVAAEVDDFPDQYDDPYFAFALDDDPIDERNVKLVMDHSDSSRSDAVCALRENGNDVVDAIVELTSDNCPE